MKNITSSVYTFEDIVKDDFLYVDKTEFIWNLIRQGKAMYFSGENFRGVETAFCTPSGKSMCGASGQCKDPKGSTCSFIRGFY